MDAKKVFLLIFIPLSSIGQAQESVDKEALEKLRETPDTSLTTYLQPESIEQASREDSLVAEEVGNSTTRYGQGVKVSDGMAQKRAKEANRIRVTPVAGTALIKQKSQAEYSDSQLEMEALRIAANCKPIDVSGRSGGVVINLGDDFFVIPSVASSLPPHPANSKTGIHGVDVNKNCVRDDIEHLVFDMFPNESQSKTREYYFRYSIWLNFFLIENIEAISIRAIERQILKTGLCLKAGFSDAESSQYETKVFARMHNTDERTLRYFENREKLTGFDIEVDTTSSC